MPLIHSKRWQAYSRPVVVLGDLITALYGGCHYNEIKGLKRKVPAVITNAKTNDFKTDYLT